MNFPVFHFPFHTIEENDTLKIYDCIRKKYVVLTPEEWVRQHVIYLLVEQHKISKGRIAVERQVTGTTKRFDILIHNTTTGLPEMIIECKAYDVTIGQETLNQVGQYNRALNVPYLIVTNWHQWIAAEIRKGEQTFTFLDSFPNI